MQIRTIQKGFKAFECKFEPFEKNSNHLKGYSKHSNANSSLSKAIQSIQMQILTIWKGN